MSVSPRTLIGLVACGGLVLTLSATGLPPWFTSMIVVAVLILAVPLGVRRRRLEQRVAEAIHGALSRRR